MVSGRSIKPLDERNLTASSVCRHRNCEEPATHAIITEFANFTSHETRHITQYCTRHANLFSEKYSVEVSAE